MFKFNDNVFNQIWLSFIACTDKEVIGIWISC